MRNYLFYINHQTCKYYIRTEQQTIVNIFNQKIFPFTFDFSPFFSLKVSIIFFTIATRIGINMKLRLINNSKEDSDEVIETYYYLIYLENNHIIEVCYIQNLI